MKKRKMGVKGIIIIVVVIIALFLSLINFLTDYLWFKELSYVSVFFKQLFTQLKIGIPTFVIITFLAYVYLKVLKRGYFKKIKSDEYTNEKTLNLISWGLAAVFGALVTFIAVTRLWFQVLELTNSTNFSKADPLFGLDISFYVFKLGFIMQLNQILIGVIIAFAILTIVYYLILLAKHTPNKTDGEPVQQDDEEHYGGSYESNGSFGNFGNMGDVFGKFAEAFTGKKPGPRPVRQKPQMSNDNLTTLFHVGSNQISIVGVLFFLMIGVNFFLKQFQLLHNHTGAVYGAGFTDVNVTLWVYRIVAVLSVVAAVAFVAGMKKKKVKTMLIVPIIMIVVGLVGAGAGALIQNLVVTPDEIAKESKYLESNIEYTQAAYGLNNVQIKPFTASNKLTSADIAKNEDTINNIRINDYDPAKTFYNQTQSIRQYYTFNNVDVDRYMINGEYTQTFLSAREIDESKISQAWLNKHLKYTHGYGITLSRVDEITASGQPDMLIDSIPPISQVAEIQIKRPEIYFGESTDDYVLVGTDEDEFDYPDGDNNKYARYKGDAGINLNMLNRVMFAIREKSLKILVSTNLDSKSKIIINRNVEERVEKIMPYLSYEKDPYMVTVNGKLYWIMDAYTTSDKYPYSEPYEETSNMNYIRNSVKVVVDAYNGDTNFYIVDNEDPIANTYKKIYPKLFKSFEEMPKELQGHIRYPNTMFNIQASVYKRYHMNDVKVFYQNEDLWDISKEIYGTREVQMTPNYYIMKLPGESQEEFVNSIPYTPRDKKNMTGLMVARNDGDKYGDLVLYKFPKSKVVYGPMQVEAQIDQNTEISKEFSLWSSAGSTYNRGDMFVIPIEDSLLYVEPVYLEATNSSIPEVKRVIVAYNDQIAYESTLGEALNELFGEGAAEEQNAAGNDKNTTNAQPTQTELITKAQEAFNNAQQAQKDGDWAKYGEYIKQLENYLNQLSPKRNTDTTGK